MNPKVRDPEGTGVSRKGPAAITVESELGVSRSRADFRRPRASSKALSAADSLISASGDSEQRARANHTNPQAPEL